MTTTNQANLTLVAHSQGTSSAMALLSTNTEYNDKLNLLVLMSPIGYMGGVTSPIPLWMADHITEIMVGHTFLIRVTVPVIDHHVWMTKSLSTIFNFSPKLKKD